MGSSAAAGIPDLFDRFLQTRGLRLTRPRLRILEAALAREDHFSADELAERLRRAPEGVSKATVYRTLALLRESGFLEEHDFGGGRKFYEPAMGRTHHDHLVCIGCGRITEFVNERIERMQDQVARRERFTPVTHSLKIFGYCRGCRKPASGAPSSGRMPRRLREKRGLGPRADVRCPVRPCSGRFPCSSGRHHV